MLWTIVHHMVVTFRRHMTLTWLWELF